MLAGQSLTSFSHMCAGEMANKKRSGEKDDDYVFILDITLKKIMYTAETTEFMSIRSLKGKRTDPHVCFQRLGFHLFMVYYQSNYRYLNCQVGTL